MTEPKWPRATCGMSVEHNVHRQFYETVEQALESGTYDRDDFASEDEVRAAIATDSVWTIRWYPDTPVGFVTVAATTFERALAMASPPDEG